jgi:hypothetical protein
MNKNVYLPFSRYTILYKCTYIYNSEVDTAWNIMKSWQVVLLNHISWIRTSAYNKNGGLYLLGWPPPNSPFGVKIISEALFWQELLPDISLQPLIEKAQRIGIQLKNWARVILCAPLFLRIPKHLIWWVKTKCFLYYSTCIWLVS